MRASVLALPLLAAVACVSTPTPTPPAPTTTTTAPAGPKRPPPPALPEAPRPVLADAPSTPTATHQPTLIRGAKVMTAAGAIYARGFVLLENGRITAVGEGDGTLPPGGVVVDATGRVVTPGLIDTHSHMGVYATPSTEGNSDGNEVNSPRTADVWSEHGFWPQDASLPRALQKGITTIQVLPGSANLIGGRSTTFKLGLVGAPSSTSARALRFPGAPQGLKMACGQNPKRVYGRGGRPSTRMGNIALQRAAFQEAVEYQRRWQRYERDLAAWRTQQTEKTTSATTTTDTDDDGRGKADDPPDPPSRDLALETLVGVLDRADEMNLMLDVAKEFGFQIRSFHHAVEAYKLAPRLAAEGVSVSTWVDWWGFKMESLDAIRGNVALLQAAGARPILHSDSDLEIRQLNQEAGKALAAARQLGLSFSDDEALRWITANPAWALGVLDQTGTLEPGKMADVVIWNGSPFSVYSRPEQVFVDGVLVVDGSRPLRQTDIDIGTAPLSPAPPSPRVELLKPGAAAAPSSSPTSSSSSPEAR
jgi:imidazolonepropionase-like amidohydrolase